MTPFRLRWPGRGGVAALLAAALLLAACDPTTNFPDPSDPVANIPWPDYELLRYVVIDQTNRELGAVDFEIAREGDEYHIRVLFVLDDPEGRDEVDLWVAADTLQPLRYERRAVSADQLIEVSGVYSDGGVDVVVIEDGEREEERVETGEFAFDNDSSAYLWRSIAFEQDAQVSYRSVNVPQGRSQLVRLRVLGQDLISVPAGEFLSWQVEIRPGLERQNVWYSVDPPHVLVRWDQEPRRFLLREIVTERPAAP